MTRQEIPEDVRAIVFDVGETLVDETRLWGAWAREVGATPLAVMGVLGGLIERGEDHRRVWTVLGVSAPQRTAPIEYGDIYSDAVECLHATREAGYVVGIAGNQPAGAVQQLDALGFAADFVGSSTDWGVAKPSRGFFERILAVSGFAPGQVLYVGDRLDNDILPACDLGIRTAFLRRGPWGYLHALRAQAASADLRIDSLDELTELVRRTHSV